MASSTDTRDQPPLVGISVAAERAGVSERALRYYQQLGLLAPACTAGGFRRYTVSDLERVARIREFQSLLGLDLDEIAVFMRHEDRVAEIRTAYNDARTGRTRRRELVTESLALHEQLRATVESKHAALGEFLGDLDTRIARIHDALDEQRKATRATRKRN